MRVNGAGQAQPRQSFGGKGGGQGGSRRGHSRAGQAEGVPVMGGEGEVGWDPVICWIPACFPGQHRAANGRKKEENRRQSLYPKVMCSYPE